MGNKTKGLIFDIQRYSVHDGPGIRTLIFFKGCPLRCKWCCNPESWHSYPQLMYDESSCVKCGNCISACSRQAIQRQGATIVTDRKSCQGCGDCEDECYYGARRIAGKYMSVTELVGVIEKDTIFYRNSGGGVTLSGGEVLMQADFAVRLLKKCKKNGFHTAIETCGQGSIKKMERLLPYLDLVLYDLKNLDDEGHRNQTGAGNKDILLNLRMLVSKKISIIPRIPLIPGLNDAVEELEAVCRFLKEVGLEKIDILAYHRLGLKKYDELGMDYPIKQIKPFSAAALDEIVAFFKSRQFEVGLHRL